MKLKINPTRQELLKLKKRLKIAKSGHKLLREKLDGLMREFLGRINKLRNLRKTLEEKLPVIFFDFLRSQNNLGPKNLENLLSHIPQAEIETSTSNIMGVNLEGYDVLNKKEIMETPFSVLSSNYYLEKSRKEIIEIFQEILNYANLTNEIKTLSAEIERNRRRVNSLEYVYIPEMIRTKKYITQKLEEGERFNRAVLLKLKTLIG